MIDGQATQQKRQARRACAKAAKTESLAAEAEVAETAEDARRETPSRGERRRGCQPTAASRRRATAQSMAASQRDISVSEFFAKNRHLLGFDNPRKALLTTVKEAVDNSLDACEEAGILPEIWVHVEQTGTNRYKVGVQDNGPGILKKQIPLIFGKLLYGSKFHRLRMSRGQQGIGISAAGMYGVLTTGKPVKIVSKISPKKPAHYYEIKIDTKKNLPEILNGKGEGVDIPPDEAGRQYIEKHGIEWVEIDHGTRVTIELEGKYLRGRGSVDEYLEQTAIANPHVTIHYLDPEPARARREEKLYERSTDQLPREPKEIKPHPYGIELGMLVAMLTDAKGMTLSQFLTSSFSKVSSRVASKVCETAGVSTRTSTAKVGRNEADKLFQALRETQDRCALDRLHFADRRGTAAQGIAPRRAGRVLRRGHASAGRLSRQPVPDRSGAGLWRHVERQHACRSTCWKICWTRPTPARCGSS